MFRLPPHLDEKFSAARAAETSHKQVFANLSDEDLVTSAKFWMSHCAAPRQYAPDEPIYDATFWHVIVPELLRRVRRK